MYGNVFLGRRVAMLNLVWCVYHKSGKNATLSKYLFHFNLQRQFEGKWNQSGIEIYMHSCV